MDGYATYHRECLGIGVCLHGHHESRDDSSLDVEYVHRFIVLRVQLEILPILNTELQRIPVQNK